MPVQGARHRWRHASFTSPTSISGATTSPSRSRRSRRLVEEVASGARDRQRRPHAPRPAARSTRRRPRSCAGSACRCSTIPGNHDIPYTFPKRFTSPGRSSSGSGRRPSPSTGRDGSSSSGSTRCGRGATSPAGSVTPRSSARPSVFAGAPESALRIVAFHHHLLGAPWRSRKKPVAKRNRVLAGLVEAGADLVLAGHIHQSTVAERREFELSTPGGRARRRRLDRARVRPAAAEPPRRGPRPARLRGRGRGAAHPHLHLARGRLGAHGRAHVPARP